MDSPLVSVTEKNSDNGNYLKWTIQWTYCAKDSSTTNRKQLSLSMISNCSLTRVQETSLTFGNLDCSFPDEFFFFSFSLPSSCFIWLILEKDLWMHDIIHIPAKREFYTWQALDIALPRQFHHTPLSGAVDVLSVQRYVWRHSKT